MVTFCRPLSARPLQSCTIACTACGWVGGSRYSWCVQPGRQGRYLLEVGVLDVNCNPMPSGLVGQVGQAQHLRPPLALEQRFEVGSTRVALVCPVEVQVRAMFQIMGYPLRLAAQPSRRCLPLQLRCLPHRRTLR